MERTGSFDSWDIVSDKTAIKHCDKSFFNYNGSGIPKEICWFFGAQDLLPGGKIAITLQYQQKTYDARIINESTDRRRTRIFWGSELGALFNHYRGSESASAAFYKIGETAYRVEIANSSDELVANHSASQRGPSEAEELSFQDQFKEWLLKKGTKHSYERVTQHLAQADEFCKKIKVLKRPLLETSDVAAVSKALQAVSRNKIFRFKVRKSYNDIISAINLYYAFLKELQDNGKALPQKESANNGSDVETLPTKSLHESATTGPENQEPTSTEAMPATSDTSNVDSIQDSTLQTGELSISEPPQRWVHILREGFPDGYILDDFLSQFQARALWQEYYGEVCPLEGTEIDEAIKPYGIIRDGRIFEKNDAESQLISEICSVIEHALDEYSVVYRSCIYEKYQRELSAQSIYTESVMTDQILSYAKGKFVKSYTTFIRPGKYGAVTEACRKVLRNQGGAMSVDEVAKVLWFVPRDVVYHSLSVDNACLNVGYSLWMLVEHFPLSADDAQIIGDALGEHFLSQSYIRTSDIRPLLQAKLPSIAENLSGLNDSALFNILEYYLRDRYSFSGSMISVKGTKLDLVTLFQRFAEEHESFSLAELDAYAKELNAPIYWESTFNGGAVRISKTEFVNSRLVSFNVEAVDRVLNDLCSGDYLSIQAVSSAMMMHLPPCGYRWNGYLLLCYIYGFSKQFRFLYNSLGKSGYYGAIVRKNCLEIENYSDLLERVLTDDDTWSSEEDALALIVKNGYQARQRLNGIDKIVSKARLNKLANEG